MSKPVEKRGALPAVQTPDKTVWSFRASDFYQGGETEPIECWRAVLDSRTPLDIDFQKNYHAVVALNVCAHPKKQIQP